MGFVNREVYVFKSHRFQKMRILQGAVIYSAFAFLLILGSLSGEARLTLGIALAVFGVYLALLGFYWRRLRSLGDAAKLALLKLLTVPTSMLG